MTNKVVFIAVIVLCFMNITTPWWFSSSTPTQQVDLPVVHRKKAALCALVKYEELYLDEWVDFHHGLGFDTFYIYDNSDGFEMKQWGELKGAHVNVMHMPGRASQILSYIDCHRRVATAGIFEWIAFFDVDEFLVLRKHDHVTDMLEEHCPSGKLGVNWLFFLHNNWILQAPEPMTRRFLYRQANTDQHIKTIARVADIVKINFNSDPHNMVVLKGGRLMHDTNKHRFKGPFNRGGPIDVVALHHYNTKSYKERVRKRLRGRASKGRAGGVLTSWTMNEEENLAAAEKELADALETDRLPLTISMNPELVFDDSAWQLMKKNVPAYGRYDEIALLPSTNMTFATN